MLDRAWLIKHYLFENMRDQRLEFPVICIEEFKQLIDKVLAIFYMVVYLMTYVAQHFEEHIQNL